MAELVGKPKETVWDAIARFTSQLDQLQHKGETITSEAPFDPEVVSAQYWNKVATNSPKSLRAVLPAFFPNCRKARTCM